MRLLYLPSEYAQQRQREKRRYVYPVRMAMEATYHQNLGHDVMWCSDPKISSLLIPSASGWKQPARVITTHEGIPFHKLPRPDRILTDAFNPIYQNNGNFKYLPGTYTMASSGCWWGKCEFCIEKTQSVYTRPVEEVVDEIDICQRLGFREVFDDSATFPIGSWLTEFCYKVKRVKGVRLGCNMRLVNVDYKMMRDAGFRMVLFGLESASTYTRYKINKCVVEDAEKYIVKAAKAGLEPHVAVMFGYPWETDEYSIETLKLVHWLLRKGYAKTAQASFYTVKGETANASQRKYVDQIYRAAFYPDFWFNKLRDIRNVDDIKYLWRSIKEGVSCTK